MVANNAVTPGQNFLSSLDGTERVEVKVGSQVAETTTEAIADLSGAAGGVKQAVFGFDIDPETTSGLTLGLKTGRITFSSNADFNSYAAGTVQLKDNTLNQLFLCPDLGDTLAEAVVVVDANLPTPPLPIGLFLLYFVNTENGQIKSDVDWRCSVFAAFSVHGIITDFSFIKVEGAGPDKNLPPFIVTIGEGWVQSPIGTARNSTFNIEVTNNAVNYVEVLPDGTMQVNTVGFTGPTSGAAQLFSVELQDGVAVNVTDVRGMIFAPGVPKQFIATGAAAGNIVCTGIKTGDKLTSVLRYTDGALVSVLTDEFTISANDQINNTGGTDTTGSTLLVSWTKLTA